MTDTPILPLVAEVISASLAQTHAVTGTLIDSLMAQLDDAQARRQAVEYAVERLIGGDYMPTPAAIRRALHPSDEVVARWRDRRLEI